MKKHRYYIISPRGFANETEVVRVDPHETELAQLRIDALSSDPNAWAHWVTRRYAEQYTARNRAKYRSGECNECNPAGATSIHDFDDRCYGER